MSSNRDLIIHRENCISLIPLPQSETYRNCSNPKSIDRRNRQSYLCIIILTPVFAINKYKVLSEFNNS